MRSLLLKKILTYLGLVVIFLLLLVLWLPIARVYFNAPQPIGFDFPQFLYYVNYFSQDLSFPPAGWKAHQFEGIPQILDYAWLHFYFIQPLVWNLGVIIAGKLYPLIFLALFLLFSLLLFWELSGNLPLAALLTLAVSRSSSLYIPLYSSGVVLSSISQTFLPMSLYFLVRFTKRGEGKSLILAAVAVALGMYTHAIGLFFIFVLTLIFLVFWLLRRPVKLSEKVKPVFIFTLAVFTLGAVASFPQIVDRFLEGGYAGIQNFVVEKNAFPDLIRSTNLPLLVSFIVAFLTLPFTFRRLNCLLWPFLGALIYFLVFMASLALGINPLGGFIFPHRVFWIFPLLLGSLSAVILTPKREENRRTLNILLKATVVAVGLILIFSLAAPYQKMFYFLSPGAVLPSPPGVKVFRKASDYRTFVNESLLERFKEADDLNYRFFTLQSRDNTVYGLVSPLPQARGAFHYMNKRTADWFAWLGAVLAQETFEKERIQADVARQQAKFILDWYAVRYLFSTSSGPGEIPHHFFEKDECVVWRSSPSPPAALEIAKDCTSPIAKPVGVPAIGFIGSRQSYDYFLRNLGIINYNSGYMIPIRAGEFLEDLTEEDFENFDGLFLYDYRKKSEDVKKYEAAWARLGEYIAKGGVVLVETGSNSPEKYASELPDIFPVNKLISGQLGTTWQVEVPTEIFQKIDFSRFSPLTYEDGPWTVSYTLSSAIKPQSRILLGLGGKPVMVEHQLGKGRIIWSGLNLIYRPLYWDETAVFEGQLLAELLTKEFGVAKEAAIDFTFNRPGPEELTIAGTGARGILFKENNYGGWVAQSDGKKLKIYSAGPDFMFVKLPREEYGKPFSARFYYRGRASHWLFFLISVFSFIFILEGLIFNHRLTRLLLSPLKSQISKFKEKSRLLKDWWEKDEEV